MPLIDLTEEHVRIIFKENPYLKTLFKKEFVRELLEEMGDYVVEHNIHLSGNLLSYYFWKFDMIKERKGED